jgi:decaprenylphospho-beta-D-erythro-pentofuranosid-2-ulose 2-reductase
MTQRVVLILGARSDIAQAAAHKLAAAGYALQLAARDAQSLARDKADLEVRYQVPVSLHDFDALAVTAHEGFVDSLPTLPDIAVCAVGAMGGQPESERAVEAAVRVMRSNYEGPASLFTVLANRFEARGSGVLIGISSVAGERGRATNYVYGSAKAGFTAFLSGLRNRLAGKGVHVVTVLPGFVATRMTEGMNLPAALTARPEEVGDAILSAISKRRNVVYVRRIWRLVMLIIRMIPEPLFKRLSI